DTYEEDRYVYKGTNPDNYITFNNEDAGWRILSVEADETLKITKKGSISNVAWDTSGGNNGSNEWARPADLNTYLNSTYYNDNTKLSEKAKELIQEHSWAIGIVSYQNQNLEEQIQAENLVTWTGNIGLISASDYLRANTNTTQCNSFYLHQMNLNTCKTTNYLVPSTGWMWTMTPGEASESSNYVYHIYSNGIMNPVPPTSIDNIMPTIYLKSDIILSGSGTETNPYIIKQK
ncbi:MAG: hypothetical protein HFJ17_03360, partial [Clostridia bacterium]|nr:hypothetical protein [Clostridia bacterium]